MTWASIIVAILTTVAPIFEQWIMDWLRGALNDASPGPSNLVGALTPTDAKLFALNKVKNTLWFWQVAKRHAVDQAIVRVSK